jgi:hypothetical protein
MSNRLAALCALVTVTVWSAGYAAAQERANVIETAPVYVLPDATRQPLTQLQPAMPLFVVQTQGAWVVVSWEDPRIGRRSGYVEARLLARRSSNADAAAAPAAVAPAAPVPASGSAASAAPSLPPRPTPSAISIKNVRRLYIEKMDNDLDQYLSAEISKQLSGRVVVVLQKDAADAILRGVSSEKTGVGAAVTGRYLGLHDNASGSITLVDPAETMVLWASEAGDRSLMWGSLARGGQRKVASRLVGDLKKALGNGR